VANHPFSIHFEQAISASRQASANAHTIRMRLHSTLDDADPKLYSLALSASSDHAELQLEASTWVGHTPMMALDLALSYFAIFLRSRQIAGWQIHPTIAELETIAHQHQLDTRAIARTLAGSTLLGSVAGDGLALVP